MKTSFCYVLAFVASPAAARTNASRRHNRIRSLNTHDVLSEAMPPQAPEGGIGRVLQPEAKESKGDVVKKTEGEVDKKGEEKGEKKVAAKEDTKEEKKVDPKTTKTKGEELLGGGESGGLLANEGDRIEDGSISSAEASSNGEEKGGGGAAKVVAPLVVVGGLAGLAGYKFFNKKSENKIETEGDRDVPVATAVTEEKA
jgi:hypothetical protein